MHLVSFMDPNRQDIELNRQKQIVITYKKIDRKKANYIRTHDVYSGNMVSVDIAMGFGM